MVRQTESEAAARVLDPPPGAPVGALGTPSGRRFGQPAGIVLLVALAVGFMPLVAPKGPANSAPIDVLMGLSILAMLVAGFRSGATIRFPYVVPLGALIGVGLASALASDFPAAGAKAVAQELFLLLWVATVATVCSRSPAVLRIVLRAWVVGATAWAGVLVVAVITGQTALTGATGEAGTRNRLFFDHPNMAGNFFMIAVFVVVAGGYPRRLPLRIGACLVLISAMFLTGSNAALLSLASGGLVAVFLHMRARQGLVAATAAVTMVLAGAVVAVTEVVPPLVTAAQQSDNPMIRYSIGRGARSADARTDLFSNQYALYESGHLLGLGPSSTKAALGEASAPAVKEAHNDYLGTLVERGPLGLLAVLVLGGAVIARIARITRRPLRGRMAEAVPVPAALAGACAAFALTAVTHEVLHYRWFWALLGIIAAVHLLVDPTARTRSGLAPNGPVPSAWSDLAPARSRDR
jgi:O-antigen ligase